MHQLLYRLRFPGFLMLLFLLTQNGAKAQSVMMQPNQNSFGKNRIQYKDFNWQSYQSPNFNIYYYDGGQKLAESAAEFAEAELKRISALVGYYPYDRITFLLYTSPTDLQQSNINLTNYQFYNAGEGFFPSTKVEVAFGGSQTEWKKRISYHIAELLLNDMMYGGSLKEVLQSSYLLRLPEWFISGAAAYLAEGWSIESDDYVRDITAHSTRNADDKLLANDPRLAGQSIWNYISEKHGVSNIQNILNLTRITRDVEVAVSTSVNMSYRQFMRGWITFYAAQNNPIIPELKIPETANRISKNNSAGLVHSETHFSPNGEQLAYVVNEIGRYRLRIYDVATKKRKTILRGGYKNNEQEADYRVPQVAWKNNETLSVVVAHKGRLVLRNYTSKGKLLGEMELKNVSQVMGMSYSADGRSLVLSMVRNGQGDIYVIRPGAGAPQQLTNDLYDDLHPAFLTNTNQIVFSSNRPADSLGIDKGNFMSIADNYDIFLLEAGNQKTRFRQLTSNISNEYMPRQVSPNQLVYLSEQNGIRTLYSLNLQQPGTPQVVTDFLVSFKSYSYHPVGNKLAFISTRKGNEEVFLYPDYTLSAKDANLRTGRQEILEARMSPNSGNQNQQTGNAAPADSAKNNQPIRIDINDYQFNNPEPVESQKPRTVTVVRTPPRVEEEALVLNGPVRYTPRFGIKNFVSSFRIDPLLGLGLVMEVGMMDMFEDHRFNAGVFALTDLRSLHFYGEYAYLKKRIDYKIGFDRKSILASDEVLLARYTKTELTGTISYPLSYTTSVRALPRLAMTNFSAINRFNVPDPQTYFGGMGAEIVFDNSLPMGINMLQGTRAKAGIVSYVGMENSTTNFFNKQENFGRIYLDARHYQKIHRELIWANRLSYGHSFGPAAKRYLIGGVDNWVGNRAEDTLNLNVIDHPGDLFFTEFATPLRGFSYIARKGSKYVLFNSELRVPIVQYLSNGPVYSGFLRNLQLQAFTDIGTAYNGLSPFNSRNSFNHQIVGGNGNPFTAEVTNYRNPFLIGYGFGVRTTVAGFYAKLDVAWGHRESAVTGPKFYFSLGYDF